MAVPMNNDKDMKDCERNLKDCGLENVAMTSTKRDAEGNLKPTMSQYDQICSLVTKTTLYANFSNVVLVKLSLQEKWENVKIVFSKKFLKLIRDNKCIVTDTCLNQECKVIERDSQFFTFIHITFKHQENVRSTLEPDFHIANFLKRGNKVNMYNDRSFEVKISCCHNVPLKIDSEPKICNVLLNYPLKVAGTTLPLTKEALNKHVYVVNTNTLLGGTIVAMNLIIKPLFYTGSKGGNQDMMITSQLLLRSRNGESMLLNPGQLLGTASSNLEIFSLEVLTNLQELANCDEEETIDAEYIRALDTEERKELAEKKKNEGNVFFGKKIYRTAIIKYTTALLLDGNNATYYGNRSACYLAVDDAKNALCDALKSVEIDPEYVKGWHRACKAYIMFGQVEEAKEMCDNIVKLSPNLASFVTVETEKINHIVELHTEYTKSYEVGNFANALHHLDEIAQLCPLCVENHILRAQLYVYRGGFEDCRKILEENLSECSEKEEVKYVDAVLHYYEDDFEEAATMLNAILTNNPDHAKSKKCLQLLTNIKDKKNAGNALFKDEKFQEAVDFYTDALEIDKFHAKANAKLFCNRAACYFKMGKYSETIDDCSSAVQLDKSYQKAFHRRALAFMETEAFDQAVKDYEQLVALDPQNKEYHQLLKEAKVKLVESKNKDFYAIIGVARDASSEDIRKAYRKAAMVHHPDRHSLAEDNIKNFHLRKFKEIGEAYGVLSEPGKRALYDQGRLHKTVQAPYNYANSAAAAAAVHAKVYAQAAAAAQAQAAQAAAGASFFGAGPGLGGVGLAGARPGFVYLPQGYAPFVNNVNINAFTGHNIPRYQRRF